MNIDKLLTWVMGIVIVFSAAGKIDVLQRWIWQAEAKAIYASRTSTWGSPRFFPNQTLTKERRAQKRPLEQGQQHARGINPKCN